MQFYLPTKGITVQRDGFEQQSFLTQVLLPKISNSKDKNKIYKFFKEAYKKDLDNNFEDNKKIICFNPSYGCDFETEYRFSAVTDREKHLKLMQSLRPEQKAVLSPYIRLLLVPDPNLTKVSLKNSIPLAFNKSFDLDFFLGNNNTSGFQERLTAELQSPFGVSNDVNSFSRGEAAFIKSLNVEKMYNNTAIFDPVDINMSFYFSSFSVFANKPAIEKGSAAATFLNRVSRTGSILGGFSSLNDLRYTELITYQAGRKYRLLLEYGWKVDDSVSESIFSFFDKQLIKKFEKSYYLLEPTKHNIDFEEDGGMNLTVKYVPSIIDNLHKSVDIKTGIFYNNAIYKKIKESVNQDLKDSLKKIKEIQDTIDTSPTATPEQKIKAKASLSGEKFKLSNNKNFNFANLFKTYFEKSNLIYTAEVGSQILKNPNRTSFNLELSRKDMQGSLKINESFTFEQIRKQIIDVQKSSSDKKAIRFLGLGPSGEDNVENVDIEEVYSSVFKKLFRATDNPKTGDKIEGTKIRFVLFRDVLAVLLRMANTVDPVNPSPYTILSNFAMPMPNGEKFWCNIGDIPIELRLFTNIINTFFNQKPNGTLNNLLQYMFRDVFPVILVERSKKYTLPALSYPFYNFDRDKWEAGTSKKKTYNDIANGDVSTLKNFGKVFFDDTKFESSVGCVVFGQTPRISQDNSKLNLGKNIDILSKNFLNDDKKLTKLGVGKLVLGNSVGIVKKLSFAARGDEYQQNLNYELNKLKPGVGDVLLSSTYQYNLTALCYGNKSYQFSNIMYVPAGGLGYSPLTVEQALGRGGFDDFELGGLYVVMKINDTIDYQTNSYTTTLTALSCKRESDIVDASLKAINEDARKKNILTPTVNPKVNFAEYIYNNAEGIDRIMRVQIDNLSFEADILDEALQSQFEEDILNEASEDIDREEQVEQRVSNLNRATGVQPAPEVSGLNTEAFSRPFGSSASNLNTDLSLGGDE